MSSRVLPRLYLLTDRYQTCGRPLTSVLSQAMESGVRMVQIREKDLETRDLTALVHTLLPLVKQYKGSVLLNDRIDLVLALGADGVHLRADSLPVLLVRRLLGPDHLIGVSAHSAEDVQRAEDDGADFVVLGPIFDTPSKRAFGNPLGMEVLQNVCRTSRGPFSFLHILNRLDFPTWNLHDDDKIEIISFIGGEDKVQRTKAGCCLQAQPSVSLCGSLG